MLRPASLLLGLIVLPVATFAADTPKAAPTPAPKAPARAQPPTKAPAHHSDEVDDDEGRAAALARASTSTRPPPTGTGMPPIAIAAPMNGAVLKCAAVRAAPRCRSARMNSTRLTP